jgi:hypothetical protein
VYYFREYRIRRTEPRIPAAAAIRIIGIHGKLS